MCPARPSDAASLSARARRAGPSRSVDPPRTQIFSQNRAPGRPMANRRNPLVLAGHFTLLRTRCRTPCGEGPLRLDAGRNHIVTPTFFCGASDVPHRSPVRVTPGCRPHARPFAKIARSGCSLLPTVCARQHRHPRAHRPPPRISRRRRQLRSSHPSRRDARPSSQVIGQPKLQLNIRRATRFIVRLLPGRIRIRAPPPMARSQALKATRSRSCQGRARIMADARHRGHVRGAVSLPTSNGATAPAHRRAGWRRSRSALRIAAAIFRSGTSSPAGSELGSCPVVAAPVPMEAYLSWRPVVAGRLTSGNTAILRAARPWAMRS